MRLRIGFGLAAVLAMASIAYLGFSGTGFAAKGKETPVKMSARPGMAVIPAGCFMMGNHFPNEVGITKDDVPVHQICFAKDFFMDVYEVTNARYRACVDAGKCGKPYTNSWTYKKYYGAPEFDSYPVIGVTWFDAEAFCAFEGKRLPTEAQWEYAARGGLEGKRFPWGDNISCSVANWGSSETTGPCYIGGVHDTSKVGSYQPNGYGLHDMYGNVWEWVSDWFDKKYYRDSPADNPPGPEKGKYKVQRGGAFTSPLDQPGMPTVSWRAPNPPKHKDNNLGIRCAAD